MPDTVELQFLVINDFHGRIDTNTLLFAGTVEKLRAAADPDAIALISTGDNIGASLFASAVARDQPTLDVLNALELKASAVGNHEFDGGWADLRDRVVAGGANARFPILGANVYGKGTIEPVLPEFTVLRMKGIRVAIIGTVTQEVPSLVSPAGITDLEFGDAVDAINRAAARITSEGLADIIVAASHDGAGGGTPEGSTLERELAAGGPFAKLVNGTTPDVVAIFTGHTHKEYAWNAQIPDIRDKTAGDTRPIVQAGNYGENVGLVTLTVDRRTMRVASCRVAVVKRTTESEDELAAVYPRVAAVQAVVDQALAEASEVGNEPVGLVTADITTAFIPDPFGGLPKRDNRAAESTLGNLVADSLLHMLKAPELGGAEIGVVNPGGLRNELYFAPDGVITYAEADAVLPFANNLWTTSLTGEQLRDLLEEQWQTNADGSVPSRPYLQLGLSRNVNYTYDGGRTAGDRITSIRIDSASIDPARTYRIGTFGFLVAGGDNFRSLAKGTGPDDSGLVDRDAWIAYLREHSPVSPDFTRRAVAVANRSAAVVHPGDRLTLGVSGLNLTSIGSPVNTALVACFTDASGVMTPLGSVTVEAGAADVRLTVPASAAPGRATLMLTAVESGSVVRIDFAVQAPWA